ncbi:MFS transporter [Methanorbis rubei]|uniref:Riboflavin transporter RibZ n=1 Tax=Methanorbis rubei TaxID=3028300 RepID=A0AAE4MGY5_9EURY|nr:Riboflavin transporter RibZ [Methanocorpusculaceae archaeon Cs1]
MQAAYQYTIREMRMVLIAAALASFLSPFLGSMVNVAIPAIGITYTATAESLAMLSTAYLISSVVFMVPAARVADLIGRKKIFLAGIFILAVSSILAPHSPTIEVLILCRILEGIGVAAITSNSIALLSAVYPPQKRGAVIGYAVSAVFLGLSAGPILGGFMTQMFDWHSIFYFVVVLCIVAFIAVWFSISHDIRESAGEPYDYLGTFVYMLLIISIVLGLINLPELWAVGLFAVGVCIFLPLFFFTEKRTAYPVFAIRLFDKNPVFTRGNIATVINFGATYAISFFLSMYLQFAGLLTPVQAGVVLVAMPFTQMIFSPLAGKISDKIEPRYLTTAGMLVMSVGLCVLLQLGEVPNLPALIATLMVMGFAVALFASPNNNMILGSVQRHDYGSANSIIGTMRQMGMVLSMGLATCFISIYLGTTTNMAGNLDAFLDAMHWSFFCGMIFCLIAAVLSFTCKTGTASK